VRELRGRSSGSARFGRRRTLAQPLVELQDYPVGILEQARIGLDRLWRAAGQASADVISEKIDANCFQRAPTMARRRRQQKPSVACAAAAI
jgi:hypothetical protein